MSTSIWSTALLSMFIIANKAFIGLSKPDISSEITPAKYVFFNAMFMSINIAPVMTANINSINTKKVRFPSK